ncbi:MAG: 4-alpha-glucanotransferase [Synergistaceae bacterium]|jgi:4-alpha-glucanotransferase|nr:4-alpha-glucanotransferase [Synergistaceae bacterium]
MGDIRRRGAGVLMHISSLPGMYGVGDMGHLAAEFARIMSLAGISAWQMLPLVPTSALSSNSPYSSPSSFAGNILFISPDKLAERGLIDGGELKEYELPQSERADFARARRAKKKILATCHSNFRRGDAYRTEFREISDKFWDFCRDNAHWLEDYALFSVLKELEGGAAWSEWGRERRERDWNSLNSLKREPEISAALDLSRFEQFVFFSQMEDLRRECRELGIELIGDLPIYVAYDSADVWGHQDLFELDEEGAPTRVAGVPPDYFSETGQRWGNPIYRWDRMRENGYLWWLSRLRHALAQADRVRIDHFRGLLGFWEIPADEPTAVTGAWKPGPGNDLFNSVRYCFADESDDRLPFIAEDLGVMTDDVIQSMEEFGLPGMKILQFAFGEGMEDNPYIPHNHRRNCVVYAGTHDNDTSAGWWEKEATETERRNFMKYLGRPSMDARAAADEMIRLALSSTADLAVLTVQDILRLGSGARMNVPSTVKGNWEWKLTSLKELRDEMPRIAELVSLFGRGPRRIDNDGAPR